MDPILTDALARLTSESRLVVASGPPCAKCYDCGANAAYRRAVANLAAAGEAAE